MKIVSKPKKVLEGQYSVFQYWTDRRTRGDIQVLFKTKVLADRFSM